MKTKGRNIRIGTIGKAALGIVAVAGVVPLLAMAPGIAVAAEPFLRNKKYSHKQAIDRNIESLISHKLVKRVVASDGTISLQLTRLGKWEAGIRGLDKEKKHSQTKWDKRWRIVIFDIPESKKHVRQELRRAMSLYGFHLLQQSVWVYPYACEDFIVLVTKRLGIKGNVLYLTANYIENDSELKREFKLIT